MKQMSKKRLKRSLAVLLTAVLLMGIFLPQPAAAAENTRKQQTDRIGSEKVQTSIQDSLAALGAGVQEEASLYTQSKSLHTLTECIADEETDTASLLSAYTGGNQRTSDIQVKWKEDAVILGKPIEVLIENAPETYTFSYHWEIGDISIVTKENSYTVTENDAEQFLTCTVTAEETDEQWKLSAYISSLPVVYVNTENGQEITDKENYLDADCKIQGNAEFSDSSVLYDGEAQIRGRGNYTWAHEKKPYKLKLDKKTSVFGMDNSKHWVLLANWVDTTHTKNELFGNLSEDLGWEYTANAQPVVLILNGRYNGVYHLSENIRIEEGRVDIHDWESDAEDIAKAAYKAENSGLEKADRDAIEDMLVKDLSWISSRTFTYKGKEYNVDALKSDIPTDITGGYLLELDTYDAYHATVPSDFLTNKNQQMTFKSPEYVEGTNDAMFSYVKDYIQAYENACSSEDHTTVYNEKTVGYSELFEMDTIVRYWLNTEIITNGDGMRFSNYMYKDIGWDKFKMGPMWDYDWTFNNGTGAHEWQTFSYVQENNDHWYKYLVKDPYFVVQAYEMYKAHETDLTDMVKDGGDIDTIAAKVKTAAQKDLEYWHGGLSYDETLGYMKSFAEERVKWLSKQFLSVKTLMESLGCTPTPLLLKIGTADTASEKGETHLEITDIVSMADSIVVLCNGKLAGEFPVSEKKASVSIPDTLLTTKKDGLNTVQIFVKMSSGKYASKDGEPMWNYTTFQKADLYVETPDTNTPDTNLPDKDNGSSKDDSESKDDSGSKDNGTGTVETAKVTLNAKRLTMQVKTSTNGLRISSQVPAADTVLKWESSNPKVVKVSKKGKLTAKKAGTAVITLTMRSGATAVCKVKVQKKAVKTEKLKKTSKKPLILSEGQKCNTAYVRTPFTASDKLSYTSTNSKVIKLSKNGVLKAGKAGKAKITIKAGKKKCTIQVRVGKAKKNWQ